MIPLIRLDGSEVIVNAELIATVEKTPDTMLTLTTGHHILVKDKVEDVVRTSSSIDEKFSVGQWSYRKENSRWISVPSAASFSPSA
jgi:flagellar protein FlbD